MRSVRRCDHVLVVAVLASFVAGCQPSGSAGAGSAGSYSGKGHNISEISFEVSSDGSAISHLQGYAGFFCASGYGIGGYEVRAFSDAGHSTAVRAGAFDELYQIPGTQGEIRFQGHLDSQGGAAGSLVVKSPGCDTQGTWSAATKGHRPMAEPTGVPAASAPGAAEPVACSRQPCGLATGTELDVMGVSAFGASGANYPDGGVAVDVTLTNRSGQPHVIISSDTGLLVGGDQQPIAAGPDPLDRSGYCTAATSLPIGAAVTARFCFPLTQAQLAGPLTLVWRLDNTEQTSRVALPPPS